MFLNTRFHICIVPHRFGNSATVPLLFSKWPTRTKMKSGNCKFSKNTQPTTGEEVHITRSVPRRPRSAVLYCFILPMQHHVWKWEILYLMYESELSGQLHVSTVQFTLWALSGSLGAWCWPRHWVLRDAHDKAAMAHDRFFWPRTT